MHLCKLWQWFCEHLFIIFQQLWSHSTINLCAIDYFWWWTGVWQDYLASLSTDYIVFKFLLKYWMIIASCLYMKLVSFLFWVIWMSGCLKMFLFCYFCSRNFIGTSAHCVITKLHWHSLDVRCLTFSTEGSQLFYLYFMTSYVRYTQQCTEYTHPFNGPFSGTTRVSRYQKGKTNLDFTEARDSQWQWHQLGHIQVCISLQTDNHASTPPLSFFTDRMPFLPPNQQRQSTEGTEYLLKMNALSKAVTVTNACVLVTLVNLGQPVFISAFFNMFHERTFGDKCHRFLSVICLSDNPSNCLQALRGHIPAPFFLYPADCQWKRPCPFVLFTKLSPITALQKPVFTFLP